MKKAAGSLRRPLMLSDPDQICDAATMQNSMGTESMVFMREKIMAVLAAAAFSSAERLGYLPAMFSAFCWFGQITNQTLNPMIRPRYMPMPISVAAMLGP